MFELGLGGMALNSYHNIFRLHRNTQYIVQYFEVLSLNSTS